MWSFQIQQDKEKLLYELDNIQSQYEKIQVSHTRLQQEKDDIHMDADRQRERNDKMQVRRPMSSPSSVSYDAFLTTVSEPVNAAAKW